MIRARVLALGLTAFACITGTASAQVVVTGSSNGSAAVTSTPPSVDAGLANGSVKAAGAPSVGNGMANGSVKTQGAPSVDDGVANGSVKATTINQ